MHNIFYQAFVWVQGAENNAYWNKLASPRPTHAEAEADVAAYVAHKKSGTGGYRVGAPGRTIVKELAS